MAIAAGCTAFTAYLLGDFVNQAYVHKNFHNILILGGITLAIFAVRGAALYGQAVLLSRVGNRISAANQRRMFDRLLSKNLGFSSTAIPPSSPRGCTPEQTPPRRCWPCSFSRSGRDFMTLAGLIVVMVMQDPILFFVTLDRISAGDVPAAQDGAPHPQHRACPVHRRHAHRRNHAGDAAGPAHRQGVHAGRQDARALRLQCGRGRARGEQMGARRQPHLAADGNAWRFRDRGRDRLWRLPRHPARARRRASSSRSLRRSCSPTSRRSAWRASIWRSTAIWSACACCSRSSTARRASRPTTASRR